MDFEDIDALILEKWEEYTDTHINEAFTNTFTAEEITAIENWLENHKKEQLLTHRNNKSLDQEDYYYCVVMDYIRQWVIHIFLSNCDIDRLIELAHILNEEC